MSRRTQTTESSPPVQIKHLAFNTHGHAMKDPMVDRNINEIILCFSSKSTMPINNAIKKLEKEGKTVYRNDLTYTERELGPLQPGLAKFLVVGYALRDHSNKHNTTAPEHHKQRGTGFEIPKSIVGWDEQPPLLVVAEILQSQVEGVQLWALLCPQNGICSVYQIAQHRVFYRFEFRDATTAIKERGTNWNRLVEANSVQPGEGGLSAKQERLKKARDTSRVVLEPAQSFVSEMLCLLKAFKVSGDVWHLHELQKVLAAADNDINLRPLPRNEGLRKFIENDREFNLSDAEMVVEEVAELWPEVENVTVDSVMMLRKGIQDGAGTFLEYRHIRGFLAEGSYRISIGDTVDTILACNIIGTLKRTTPEWTLPISTDQDNLLFSVILAKLKEIQAAGEKFDIELEKICGDATMFDGPHDAWESYNSSPDTDHAKLAFFGVIRYVIRAIKGKINGTDKMIAELVDVLERL
ncbi:hypothetical protein V496_07231 [Pseudogymnoascus sp. VKM F-4515 (FW-2607)]|nr:hypothetical protein V496_07231 [Pseudogymnoascus sp. VKM F-4515 (FW-2607)]KFY80254.1 hypothetical protein V498_08821 [Pseudogymnoascus sp. VKM F-4517 (FW-2822)]